KEIISETKKYLNEEDYTNVFKNLSSIHDSYYFILFVEELIKQDRDKTFEKVWEIYRKRLKSTYKDKKYMNIVMEIKSFEARNDDLYQYLKKNIEKTFKKRTKLLEILQFVDTLDFK
ncbi:MAG: phage tail protein, partial [Finegoldia magna]|nr:phage tail protein [Finegoldia magna]